jgi:hypothetical protein
MYFHTECVRRDECNLQVLQVKFAQNRMEMTLDNSCYLELYIFPFLYGFIVMKNAHISLLFIALRPEFSVKRGH